MAAMRHEAERRGVLARELQEIGPHHLPLQAHPAHVGGGILDANDILHLEQSRHGLDRHVDHRARRDVVDDQWQGDRPGHRLEMRLHAGLRRLVVIGRHNEDRIGTRLFRVDGKVHRLHCRIRAGAGDHGHAALRLVDHDFDDALVFVMAQGRALAGRANGDEAVRAFGDLPVDESAQGVFIEPVAGEGRDKCRDRARESGRCRGLCGHGGLLDRFLLLSCRMCGCGLAFT